MLADQARLPSRLSAADACPPERPGQADTQRPRLRAGRDSMAWSKALAARAAAAPVPALDHDLLEQALLIRLVEESFLGLFQAGRMNGTVHTCVGQELAAVAVCSRLGPEDWVTSNHRCHGHFIARTGQWRALIDELMGRSSGVCKGIGSSQHLFAEGFLSNGIQGSLLPVGTGIALHGKRRQSGGIVVSYLGEGTLGEGIAYEAMNLAAVCQVPQLFVCENNLWSQSTPQQAALAGELLDRPRAFGLATFEAHTWDPVGLLQTAQEAIDHVRHGRPAFLNIRTYRLNAHSKGDDDRPADERSHFERADVLTRLLEQAHWQSRRAELQDSIRAHIDRPDPAPLQLADYLQDQLPRDEPGHLVPVVNAQQRMHQALNQAYGAALAGGACMIGEDIADPYGGAFKVTRGLSTAYPDQVFSTPISEAGLVGLAIGLALRGTAAFAELMFGDFTALAFDQLLNNAAKMHHMYAFQVDVPVRLRTPMGGKRCYGPTHSQSLEKHFVGIDNTAVLALSSLLDPAPAIADLSTLRGPVLLLENKVDYGRLLWQDNAWFVLRREDRRFGAAVLSPRHGRPSLTVVSYGETARHFADEALAFFEATDEVPELVAITRLHPLDLGQVIISLQGTGALMVVEDGSTDFGIGAEVLARVLELGLPLHTALRVGAAPCPIPSVRTLETQVLSTIDRITAAWQSNKARAR